MRTIYLAGPIAGCDKGEANDWRGDVRRILEPHRIRGISPLRCEPLIGATYEIQYSGDPKFGTARAISSKNKFDVQNCDMTLAYLPAVLNARRPSYGTLIEIGWADMAGKPVVLVTDDPYLREHPVTSSCASWLLGNLDEACELIVGLLGEYARQFHD